MSSLAPPRGPLTVAGTFLCALVMAAVFGCAGCAESTTPATSPATPAGGTPAADPLAGPAANSAPPPPATADDNATPEENNLAAKVTDKLLDGGETAPEFPTGLPWLNTDHPLTLEQFRGKFVLLDFWTYCCINCMHVIPELRTLELKYPDDLVVIGVHSAKFSNEKTTSQIREAILRYEVHHPVVNDKNTDIWDAYHVDSWPTLVLINPDGKIIGAESGEGHGPLFDAILRKGVKYFAAKGALKPAPLKLDLEHRASNSLLDFPGKIALLPTAPALGGQPARPAELIVSDSDHDRIVLADLDGTVREIIGSGQEGHADGDFKTASFHHPQGVAAAATSGGDAMIYVADTENHLIRAIDLNARTVTTVLGTGAKAVHFNQPGVGRVCAINSPWDVAVEGNTLYIAMAGFHELWTANTQTWAARPFAGSGRENILDGRRLEANLAQPSGLTLAPDRLYWADSETSSIRTLALNGPAVDDGVQTVVGKGLFQFGDVDGSCEAARLQHPLGVAFHAGKLYVADTYNDKIRVIDLAAKTCLTFAGTGKPGDTDGPAAQAQFNEPGGLCFDGDTLYVADTNNHRIRTIDLNTGTVATLALHLK
ncbi:MAG: thioredoxin-like domain-containing protein [Planctomycetota bacterium]